MAKTNSLYKKFWSGKRYLKKVTCRKACDLSHPERLVLSLFVYKARDRAAVTTKTLTQTLGLDRRTVWSATRRLVSLGFLEKSEHGHKALDPLLLKPGWFADPQEGSEWWERVRTYRHYLLTKDFKRSRGNRRGAITEGDNAVLWMIHSLGKGDSEAAGQRVSGLAALLGCSPNTVRAAIGRLSKAKLIMVRSDGFTLLEPDDSVRSWWRDSRKKAAVTEEAGIIQVVDDEGEEHLVWIEPLVAKRFKEDTEHHRELVSIQMSKCVKAMQDGRVKPRETRKYWEEVLEHFSDWEPAWNFCTFSWAELWKDAYRTHASNGKYAGSCIRLLTANTQTCLSSQRNDLLSLFGA